MPLSSEQISNILKAVKSETLSEDAARRLLLSSSYPSALPTPPTRTVSVWIVVNEDDKVEASDTREDAIVRAADIHGGNEFDIIHLTLTLGRRPDMQAAITVKHDQIATLIVEPATE